MSEKNKFRGAVRVTRARIKSKPEPSFGSRIRNRPELQDRIDEERRKQLLALAPAALVTPAVVDAQIAALVVGEPAKQPEEEPLDPGGEAGAPEDDERLPVDPVSVDAGQTTRPVEPVVNDAGLREVGGSSDAEPSEGDGA